MNKPFFSICIPVYNMVDTISLSIESVLQQTCDNWELIIVDDCSTDGTWELLQQEYASHPKISLHRNQNNLKLWGNFNICIDLAKGEWWGLLAADDTYRLHALETIRKEVTKNKKIVLWTHAHLCSGEHIPAHIVPVYNQLKIFQAGKLAELLYTKGNIFGEISSYFVKNKNVKEATLQFRECSTSEDLDFWIRLLHANTDASAIYWPDVLASVLLHPASASAEITRSRADIRGLFETVARLGSLGWPLRVVIYQYIRLIFFFFRRYSLISGDRWALLKKALFSIKISGI